jgi:hypothetical protein
MKKLYSPANEIELLFLKSFLIGEGIWFYVQNDFYGSLEIGTTIRIFNEKHVYVNESDFEKASQIIKSLLFSKIDFNINKWDKFRMFIELIIFSWFVPGRSRIFDKYPKGDSNPDEESYTPL